MKSLFNAVFGKFILGTSFLLILATAHAQSAISEDSQHEKASVKYLGTQEDMIVFNVSYHNSDGTKFMLTIKDQDGSTLYQNTFNDRSFYKQFRLPKTDKDRVVFIFHGNTDADIVKAFEVNVNSRYVREVAIKRLD